MKTETKIVLKLSATARKMMLFSALFSLAAFVVGLVVILVFFHTNTVNIILDYAKGVLLGCLFALLKTVLLERMVDHSLNMDKNKATAFTHFHFVLRYILTGVMLAIAALTPGINFWGAALGLLSLQAAAYLMSALENKRKKK